jgi:hypothetical protein
MKNENENNNLDDSIDKVLKCLALSEDSIRETRKLILRMKEVIDFDEKLINYYCNRLYNKSDNDWK